MIISLLISIIKLKLQNHKKIKGNKKVIINLEALKDIEIQRKYSEISNRIRSLDRQNLLAKRTFLNESGKTVNGF